VRRSAPEQCRRADNHINPPGAGVDIPYDRADSATRRGYNVDQRRVLRS
jgi:hypothetical protein